jgi:ketosteroid isomerase-like protein
MRPQSAAEGAAVLPLYDENVVWEGGPVEGLTEREVWHGHDGIRDAFRQWYDAWEHVEHDVEEFTDVGGPHVIAIGTLRGRGRTSGIEVVRNGYVIGLDRPR